MIVGIDPSLAATGLACVLPSNDGWIVATTTLPTEGKRNASLFERARRIRGITADVIAFSGDASLAVIEAPSYGSVGGSACDRHGLFWRIVDRLLHHDIPVVQIPPMTRTKFVTGQGNADKAAVAATMARDWPAWRPTFANHSNDEADALALATIGAVLEHDDVPIRLPKYRRETVARLEVPDVEGV